MSTCGLPTMAGSDGGGPVLCGEEDPCKVHDSVAARDEALRLTRKHAHGGTRHYACDNCGERDAYHHSPDQKWTFCCECVLP